MPLYLNALCDLHNFRNRCWKPARIAADYAARRVYDLRHAFATFTLLSASQDVG